MFHPDKQISRNDDGLIRFNATQSAVSNFGYTSEQVEFYKRKKKL